MGSVLSSQDDVFYRLVLIMSNILRTCSPGQIRNKLQPTNNTIKTEFYDTTIFRVCCMRKEVMAKTCSRKDNSCFAGRKE